MSVQATVQLSEVIQGIDTEIVINTYLDRILILITQLGKVGNLIQASIPPTIAQLESLNDEDDTGPNTNPSKIPDLVLPSLSPAIHLTNLLGIAPNEHLQTLHSLYTSYAATLTWIAEEAHGRQRVPVVVGVALKRVAEEEERSVFSEIMKHLQLLIMTRFLNSS